MPEFLIEVDIGRMDHSAVKDRPAGSRGPTGRGRQDATYDVKRFGSPIVCGFEVHQITVEADERAEDSVAQPRGTLDNRVEDGLCVSGGPRNDTQDLGRRGLLRPRFSQCSSEGFDLALQQRV
jgi:hypothetical protein